MELRLSANIHKKTGGLVIALDGVLTSSTLDVFGERLEEIVLGPVKKVGLDLSKLEYIDSKGLGLLLDCTDKMRGKETELYAFGMNEDIRTILECVDFGGGLNLVEGGKKSPYTD